MRNSVQKQVVPASVFFDYLCSPVEKQHIYTT